MQLNPYGEDAVLLAVSLVDCPVNTPEELTERCRAAGVDVDLPATPTDLDATNELLQRWLAVADTTTGGARAVLLNLLLAESTAHPRLTDHDGHWHLHHRPDRLPLAEVLRALLATGTALHLAGRGMDRLGRCASQDCSRVWADVSRSGRQRYCSPTCANRAAVRRHRARLVG